MRHYVLLGTDAVGHARVLFRQTAVRVRSPRGAVPGSRPEVPKKNAGGPSGGVANGVHTGRGRAWTVTSQLLHSYFMVNLSQAHDS